MTKAELVTLWKLRNPKIKIGAIASGSKMTEAELLLELNNGAADIARLTKCIPGIHSLSIEQYRFKYAMNSYVLGIDEQGGVWHWVSTNGRKVNFRTVDYFDQAYSNWHDAASGNPLDCAMRGKEIWLRPKPSTAAYTTTLSGAISASATTMTLATSTYFPTSFRCLIGSEVIECQYHSSGSCYALVRGAEGTTAAAHANGATITMRNLLYFTYDRPIAMSADSDDPFNGITYLFPYHEGILKYAKWKIYPSASDSYDAAKGEVEYMQFIEKMKDELKKIEPILHDKLRMFSYNDQYSQ